MNTKMDSSDIIRKTARTLCDPDSYEAVYHRPRHDQPMPSTEALTEIVDRLRAVLFPGYFGYAEITPETMEFHVGSNLNKIYRLLTEQIQRGFCFVCHLSGTPSQNLAGAITGFIDLAFCMVFSTQTTCHLLAKQGTLPRWLTRSYTCRSQTWQAIC